MTYEEMEKTMQFILEQQAQFTASLQRLEETFEKSENARKKDSTHIKHLEESFLILVQLAQSHDERIVSQEERSISFDERMAYLDERMLSLVEAQIRTNEQIVTLNGRTSEINERIAEIYELMAAINERMAAINERIAETNGRTAETDERLNALIEVVERYISSRGQNDSSQG